jgi:hypothetical protein
VALSPAQIIDCDVLAPTTGAEFVRITVWVVEAQPKEFVPVTETGIGEVGENEATGPEPEGCHVRPDAPEAVKVTLPPGHTAAAEPTTVIVGIGFTVSATVAVPGHPLPL